MASHSWCITETTFTLFSLQACQFATPSWQVQSWNGSSFLQHSQWALSNLEDSSKASWALGYREIFHHNWFSGSWLQHRYPSQSNSKNVSLLWWQPSIWGPQSVFRSIKCHQGSNQPKHQPITRELMQNIGCSFDFSSDDHIMFWLAFSLGSKVDPL